MPTRERRLVEQAKRQGDEGNAADLALELAEDVVRLQQRVQTLEALVAGCEAVLGPFVAELRAQPGVAHDLLLWAQRTQKRVHGPLSALVQGLVGQE